MLRSASRSVKDYPIVRSHHLIVTFLIVFLVGCSHPLEIKGQGDIISRSGERNCSKSEQPCANLVVSDYNETYIANPKSGSTFVGWEGCGDQYPTCSFNVPATYVRGQWFKTMPSLKAIFEPIAVPSVPTEVVVRAGLRKVEVSWNKVSGATSYNLYSSTESLGNPVDIDNYASFGGGNLLTGITGTTHTFADSLGGTTYYFVVVAVNGGGASEPSKEQNGLPITGVMNDTGITWGGDYPDGNSASCIGEKIAAQDCSYGRDTSHNDDTDGDGGFSFTKLDASGNALAASVDDWSCVQDNVTGLIWEVKTDSVGLHNRDDNYNWYNTNSNGNGGADGNADDDGDICYDYNAADYSTYCNTEAYVARVNSEGLCGANDWRLPHIKELAGIANKGRTLPAIDSNYFPHTVSDDYWSSSPAAFNSNGALIVNFIYGSGRWAFRDHQHSVRLVRGGQ
jgi:hypothetical protein